MLPANVYLGSRKQVRSISGPSNGELQLLELSASPIFRPQHHLTLDRGASHIIVSGYKVPYSDEQG